MTAPKNGPEGKLSAAGWIAIIVLLSLLGWAVWYAMDAWNAMRAVAMSRLGWVFLVAGIVVTFLVGAGLMGLVFYSSRHDMDQ